MLSTTAFASWLIVVMMAPPGRGLLKSRKTAADDDAASRSSSSSGQTPPPPPPTSSTVDLEWTEAMHEAAAAGAELSSERRGKYSCCECRVVCLRDGFLILATTADGEWAPWHDWQDALYGTCYACFRGRGPWQGEDGFAGVAESEQDQLKCFAKMAKQRHHQPTDIKRNDLQRWRAFRYDALLDEEMQKNGANRKKLGNKMSSSSRRSSRTPR